MINSVSQANTFFQDLQTNKREKNNLNAAINNRMAHLVTYLRQNGPTLMYKGDLPVIVEAVKKTSKKLDKSKLAGDLEVPANSLNAIKIARLVETGRLTAAKLAEYQYEEEDYRLKQRKAKKKDVEAFQNRK
ncbi:hypothetical protein CVD25_00935 [Bacillus canaveralius]|uniref:Uncharacterized protein n=1 Tax=Bacillus canaveralius TaxID=1403243 RepID=A0A2N5GPN7_9BACI|nr:hypothetical protein [Bacillus canaveralius]PLR84632.1 hypothetical protein CU635_06040 [Bacillus canaveralius]PLS00784.1 hypothetical protein CVD25_00935 [Bacillus canaveralius]